MTSFSPTRAFAVLSKEFTELRRDRLSLALIVVLPIIQLLLFGYAINTEPRHLPTAALVQDHGPLARSALSALVNSGYLDVVETADSPAELERALESGRVQFAVTIPADFSRRVVRGDNAQVLLDADATDPMAASGVAAAAAVLPLYALSRELTGAVGAGAPAMPFEVVVHRRYNPEGESALNIVPGLLGVILTMTLVMLTAMAVTREFERGTMEGLLATPVMPIEVMVGKLGPYVLVGLVQTAVIVTLGRLLFGVPMNGSWWAFLAGVVLFVLGSLALGFLISTVVRSQLQSMQLTIFYFLPSVLISGFMFPYGGMPEWAQKIGALIPVTHFIRLVRGTLLKGLGFAELWPCLAALGAFLLVVTTLAMLRYRTTLD